MRGSLRLLGNYFNAETAAAKGTASGSTVRSSLQGVPGDRAAGGASASGSQGIRRAPPLQAGAPAAMGHGPAGGKAAGFAITSASVDITSSRAAQLQQLQVGGWWRQ